MDERIDPQKAEEVIREAVRLQQEHEEGIPQQVLETSAQEIGVDPKFLHEALRRVEQERQRRARRIRTVLIALGVIMVLALFNLLYAHSVLNRAWSEVQARQRQLQNVQERQQSIVPRLEVLIRQVDQTQKERLQTLARALQNDPAQATALATQLLADPSLRNDWALVRLMDEIVGSENRIAVERKRYNEAVARYERIARQLPINLARPLLGYPAKVR